MKSKRLNGLIASVMVSTIILTISPVKAYAEWAQDSQNSWNYTEDGTNSIGWKQIEGVWYHFDNNGKMQTGWVKAEDSKWYYMNEDGSMKTGWLKDTDGTWYDLAPTGEMKTGWTQDSDGKQYFLSSSGAMQTGVIDVAGKEYALDKSGAKLIGNNVVCESNQYTTDANGVITVGANSSNGAKKFTNEGVSIIPTAASNSSTGTSTSTTTTATTSESNNGSSNHHSSSHSDNNETVVTPSVPVVTPPAPVVPTAILVNGSTNTTATIQFNEELYWKDDNGTLIKNIDYDMMTLPEVPFKVVDFAGAEVPNAITSAVYSVADKKISFTFNSDLIKSNGYKLEFLGKNYDAAGNALVVPSDNVVAIYEGSTWITKPSDPPIASLDNNSTKDTATIKLSEELYWNDNGILNKNVDFDMMALDKPPFEVVDSNDSPVGAAITSANYYASDKKIVFTFDSNKINIGDKIKFSGENYDAAGNALVVPSNKVIANYDGTNWTTKPVTPAALGSVTEVILDKTTITLESGKTSSLQATIQPDDANNKSITWTSSNSAVATVDAAGKVTAVGEGNATITAKSVDGGKTATCAVTVTAATLPTATVESLEYVSLSTKVTVSLPAGTDATLYTVTVKGVVLVYDASQGKFVGYLDGYYTDTDKAAVQSKTVVALKQDW